MSDVDSPGAWKERGNALLKKSELMPAIKAYQKALQLLLEDCDVSSIGASVVVKVDAASEFVSGMVAGFEEIDGGKTEVVLDDGREIDDVDATCIEPLAEDPDDRELQRSIYLNLARAYFKIPKLGWSIRFSSLALAVSRVLDGEYRHEEHTIDFPPQHQRKIADALYIRGKACLGCGRHVTASKHAKILCDKGIDEAKGQTLNKEIHAFRVRRMKSNRQLAGAMSEWVEQAMEMNSELTTGEAEERGDGEEEQPMDEADDNEGEEQKKECSLQ